MLALDLTTSKLKRIQRAPDSVSFDEHAQLGGQWWGADVFPLPLAKFLVRLTTNWGDRVLDPFAGIGTVGVAAASLGRKFVGFETNWERAEAARDFAKGRFQVHNSSICDAPKLRSLADAIITSPPYGFKTEDGRVFSQEYFQMVEAVFARAAHSSTRKALMSLEVMDWPEFAHGADLSTRLRQMASAHWVHIRDIRFSNLSGSAISPSSAGTVLTFWSRKPHD